MPELLHQKDGVVLIMGNSIPSLHSALSINEATLSGALDIIVIVQEDGSMKCSPFHVRFGKLQLLHCSDKRVQIDVNGTPVPLRMKLSQAGRAYFAGSKRGTELPNSVVHLEESKASKLTRENSWSYVSKKSGAVPPSKGDDCSEVCSDEEEDSSRIQFSLCKDLLGESDDTRLIFDRHKVAYDDFNSDPWSLFADPQLVVKIGNKLYDWAFGLPIIMSTLAYSLPLGIAPLKPKVKPIRTRTSKFELTSDELASLKLRPGANAIRFTVQSNFQGVQVLEATVFLWNCHSRLIISDIDGTITRSDFLGHVLPSFGNDWAQPGVASLYQALTANGYKIVYLSSRPIGHAWKTKRYLSSLNQDGIRMPVGPVIVSPDRMYKSLIREVGNKNPHLFKANALKQIADIFPIHCAPFHSGLGNKETDAIAYRAVGVPLSRIYIVNSEGQVLVTDTNSSHTYLTSFTELAMLVDEFFPESTAPATV